MNRDHFLNLSDSETAQVVHERRTVCAVAVNGTRRWFQLEFNHEPESAYIDAMCQVQIRFCRMFFQQGVDTLIMPVFGPELLSRGALYRQVAIHGMERLATDEGLIDFYQKQGVQVRFYGDYNAFFAPSTDTAHLGDQFKKLEELTRSNSAQRLFLGVCAQDATSTLAALAVSLYQQYGRVPSKEEMVLEYYGEPLKDIDLFIGFDRLSVFDIPLLSVDETDLYFTVAPSPYMTDRQLREILYDHLFGRRTTTQEGMGQLEEPELEDMRTFYQLHVGRTQGLGFKWGSVWYPLAQVEIPEHMRHPWKHD